MGVVGSRLPLGAALLALRAVLACVFLIAGVAKLADLAGSRRAVAGFGLPERLAALVGLGLPICELAAALALLPDGSARYGAVGALGLLGVFMVGIAVTMARGTEADCHCFGQLHSAPVGWRTLARNSVLAAIAAFVVVEGWRNPGVSATHWLAHVQSGWLVAGAAGVVLLGLVGFQAWFSLQLLSQNGRTLGRLEALEAAIAELAQPSGADGEPVPLGAGLAGGGLRVGSPAPVFALRSLNGEERSLRSLLAAGRPVMLVFTSAGCGPCDALLPDVAGWQRDHAGRLTVVVIAGGAEARNREKAERHGLERVLVQSERDVSDAYRAYGTPTAVVVGVDGLIASPVVGGSEAISQLVMQVTGAVVARHVPSKARSNGRAAGRPPDRSHVGELAPELVLATLDGERAQLSDLYAERTVAIFWNPGCGFCRRMLPDLKALEANLPDVAPRLVVISGGEADAVREHGFRSPVLFDPESLAMRAFNAHGTPTGVLIEQGRIASPLATGVDAVLRLAKLTPQVAMNGDASGPDGVAG